MAEKVRVVPGNKGSYVAMLRRKELAAEKELQAIRGDIAAALATEKKEEEGNGQ